MTIFKLNNPIQNYAWGSYTSMSELFGFENDEKKPQAELWMGTHRNGCSVIEQMNVTLADYIDDNPSEKLGNYTAHRYGDLPFLFKVLAAESPLSIQVHPNKFNAILGYEREHKEGVSLYAANRNYKDPNHKPELVYALTRFQAMNGFRPIEQVTALFDEIRVSSLELELSSLKAEPNAEGLQRFFSALISLVGNKKWAVLNDVKRAFSRPDLSEMAQEALAYSQIFSEYYDGDIGILSPLFLNVVELKPGEAMFLNAETPHAYVRGTGLEIMANSDNVLRAGLTSKHIDVAELIDNTRFESIEPDELKLSPIIREGRKHFPVPVDDFAFDVMEAKITDKELFVRGGEILFCIEGKIEISSGETNLCVKAGESVFVPYSAFSYKFKGAGKLARAYS